METQIVGVSPSTVSRKISRNRTRAGKYVWNKADDIAVSRTRRTPGNRRTPEALRWRIVQLIREEQWSPRQISGWFRKNEGIYISHETIYKMTRTDESGELAGNCRHKMKYRYRHMKAKETKATNIRTFSNSHSHQKPPFLHRHFGFFV